MDVCRHASARRGHRGTPAHTWRRPGGLGFALLALAVAASCGQPGAPAAVTGSRSASSSTAESPPPTPTSPPAPTTSSAGGPRCPTHTEPLSPAEAPEAFAAVVRYNERDPRFRAATLRLDRVALAPRAGARGEQVAVECGAMVAARTFVVMTTRTDLLPSQSASQGVWFVSRVSGRLRVWERAH